MAQGSMPEPTVSPRTNLFREPPNINKTPARLPRAYPWQEKLSTMLFLPAGPKEHLKAPAKFSYSWIKHRPESNSSSVSFMLAGKHQEAPRAGEGKKCRIKLPVISIGDPIAQQTKDWVIFSCNLARIYRTHRNNLIQITYNDRILIIWLEIQKS